MSRRLRFGIVPTEGGSRFAESLEEVRLAEQAGFDSAWLSEHHLEERHYWGSPLVGLAGLATATDRILLGVNVAILPFYHPLRLAEEAHLVSTMAGGRFVLGVGMGYREQEFSAFGLDAGAKGRRYEEGLKVLAPLLRGECVSHEGPHYQLREAVVRAQSPHRIPLWAGGWGEQNLRRAAQYCEAWIPGPSADLEKLLTCRDELARQRERLGRPDPADRPLTRELIVGQDDDAAWADAERYLLPNYRDEYGGGWGHPLIAGRNAELEALAKDRFLVGGPERVIEQINGYVETFGTDHVIFRLGSSQTPHDFVMRQIELLAEHVLPAFD